jgi:hypothetical protein
MDTKRVPGCALVSRRAVLWSFVAGSTALLRCPVSHAAAQSSTPVTSPLPDLLQFFPGDQDLPAGLELESAGSREQIAQLAGTFRNSRDAAQLLAGWGWLGNAYRSYIAHSGAGNTTPARIEISLHLFNSSTGAAYALSYFAHDRAVALSQHERGGNALLPCAAIVTGAGSATRFLRRGSLLVRVTVVMPRPADALAEATALDAATDLALGVLAKAGGPHAPWSAAC